MRISAAILERYRNWVFQYEYIIDNIVHIIYFTIRLLRGVGLLSYFCVKVI